MTSFEPWNCELEPICFPPSGFFVQFAHLLDLSDDEHQLVTCLGNSTPYLELVGYGPENLLHHTEITSVGINGSDVDYWSSMFHFLLHSEEFFPNSYSLLEGICFDRNVLSIIFSQHELRTFLALALVNKRWNTLFTPITTILLQKATVGSFTYQYEAIVEEGVYCSQYVNSNQQQVASSKQHKLYFLPIYLTKNSSLPQSFSKKGPKKRRVIAMMSTLLSQMPSPFFEEHFSDALGDFLDFLHEREQEKQ